MSSILSPYKEAGVSTYSILWTHTKRVKLPLILTRKERARLYKGKKNRRICIQCNGKGWWRVLRGRVNICEQCKGQGWKRINNKGDYHVTSRIAKHKRH